MFVLGPWRDGRIWRSVAQLGLDVVLGTVGAIVVAGLGVVTLGLVPTLVGALLMGWIFFGVAEWFGSVERSRAAALLGLPLRSPHPPLRARSRLRRLWERSLTPSRWVEIAYLVLVSPLLAVLSTIVLALWAGAVALLALPAYVSALPGGRAHFGVFTLSQGRGTVAACAVGLAGIVLLAPWATVGAAALDRRLVRRMLGPSPRRQLEARAERAEAQRGAAVSTAEAERRRIERDLHDGAQQRLVALAMDLGRARQQLESDPDRAAELIGAAHDEAKAALAELRELVRGVHPAVLGDRGLDAALSAVVARSPVPVTLDVRVDPRAPAEVESAAYFVVAEALTNAFRHSDAQRIDVAVNRVGGRLVVRVVDDGRGGADPALGTGLAGLETRVKGLGGWMRLVSPAGGPTTLIAELPCAS